MKVLVVTTIISILSGCATVGEPLCLPSRPTLEPISIEEQIDINPDTLIKLATNEKKLKSHISTIEAITIEHNRQFKAQCAE